MCLIFSFFFYFLKKLPIILTEKIPLKSHYFFSNLNKISQHLKPKKKCSKHFQNLKPKKKCSKHLFFRTDLTPTHLGPEVVGVSSVKSVGCQALPPKLAIFAKHDQF